MKQQWAELKAKAFNTEYSRWQRVISTLLITLMAVIPVAVFWHHYFSYDNTSCLTGHFYLSTLWLATQAVVIAQLYHSKNIVAIARGLMTLLICFGNFVYILYLFSIQACG